MKLFWNLGFRTDFLNALPAVESSSSRGFFINSCYVHCQSEMQETWFTADSPRLGNIVSSIILHIIECCMHVGIMQTSILILLVTIKSFFLQPIAEAVGNWFYDRSPFQKIDCPYPCDSSCVNPIVEGNSKA